MDIIKIAGNDLRLYGLVAHLVMDEEVVRYNLGYPYKTSPEYVWFIATQDGNTIGFIPVKLKGRKARINNYYVAGDDGGVLSALLDAVTKTLSEDYELESVTQTRHIPGFEEKGFSVLSYWKKYAKMKADGKKCL